MIDNFLEGRQTKAIKVIDDVIFHIRGYPMATAHITRFKIVNE